ncbi:MAG: UbiA family prenyltransferase [Thermoplasmata archaeon]|nr:MAG: UbiA family prenyltransferase [Thermoplasmata archaeon]
MNILDKIKERFKLYRLYAAGFMAFLPCLGALSTGSWDKILLLKLFIIGLLGHGAGYILNEIVDIRFDSKSKDLGDKPLVKGTVSVAEAEAYVWSFGIAGIIITPLFFHKLIVIMLLYLSFSLGIVYALFSKKVPGMEVIYASWAVIFTLSGAASTALRPPNLTIVLLLMVGVVMFFNVAVIGGLKDIVHDPKGGGRTTAWVLGIRVKKDRLRFSDSYFIYLTCQLFALFLVTVLAPWLVLPSLNAIRLVIYYAIVFLISFGIVRAVTNFTGAAPTNRKKVLALIRNYVILSYLLIPTIFMLALPIEIVLFITVFPLSWAIISNIITYGKIIPTI